MLQNAEDQESSYFYKSLSDFFEMSIKEYKSMEAHKENYFVILADRSKRKISYHKFEDIEKLKDISSYIFKFKHHIEN